MVRVKLSNGCKGTLRNDYLGINITSIRYGVSTKD